VEFSKKVTISRLIIFFTIDVRLQKQLTIHS